MSEGTRKTPYAACLDWIYDNKAEIETCRYGKNKRSVADALAKQEQKARQIKEYGRQVGRTERQTTSVEDAKHLKETYDGLEETALKKLNCLHTMMEIASLEDSCGRLSAEFDNKAVHLVSEDERRKVAGQETGDQQPGFLSPSAQDCIFAAKDNWEWILTLVDCMKIHLRNAADYHQFFHEVDETGQWLSDDIRRIARSFDQQPLKGDYNDAKRLSEELQDMSRVLRQWDVKTQHLWERAVKVVPVNLRSEGVKQETPCRAIAEYRTDQIHVRDGEDLLLLDNSRENLWKVRNARGQEAEVPALCILIPGPTQSGIEAAVKLRLQLLATWTSVLKRMGKRLICFMLLVFKPIYGQDEINLLRSVEDYEKADLLRILDFIEENLRKHWGDHEAFIALQERVLALRMILEESGDKPMEDQGVFKALIVQITMLEDIMRKYRNLWHDWELHKVSLETSRAPEMMLIVDKWEQLQFVSRAYMAKFWQTDLQLDDLERSLASLQGIASEGMEGLPELGMAQTQGSGEGAFGYGDGSFGFGEGSLGSGEETHRYGRGVGRGRGTRDYGDGSFGQGDGSFGQGEGSLGQGEGSFGQGESSFGQGEGSFGSGQYGHDLSYGLGEMAEEVVEEEIVETTSARNLGLERATSLVEESDFGMATETRTAQTEQLSKAEMEEKKTFTIKSVVDPRDDSEVSMNDAILAGIINPREGVYINPVTKESYPIPVAMTAGLIKVSFTTTKRSREKKSAIGIITVKTTRQPARSYKIIHVKDVRAGEELTQRNASKRGILNEQRGTFRNTKNGRDLLISDAIDEGHIEVEYEGAAVEAETVTKTYAVRAVVDTRAKTTVTFQEAVRRGILHKEAGAFRDTATGDTMYVGDAIMRGFLKARQITDTTSLNIDPENRLVIDKTDIIRKKLLQPLGVISAFRKAAAMAKESPG